MKSGDGQEGYWFDNLQTHWIQNVLTHCTRTQRTWDDSSRIRIGKSCLDKISCLVLAHVTPTILFSFSACFLSFIFPALHLHKVTLHSEQTDLENLKLLTPSWLPWYIEFLEHHEFPKEHIYMWSNGGELAKSRIGTKHLYTFKNPHRIKLTLSISLRSLIDSWSIRSSDVPDSRSVYFKIGLAMRFRQPTRMKSSTPRESKPCKHSNATDPCEFTS